MEIQFETRAVKIKQCGTAREINRPLNYEVRIDLYGEVII